MTPPVRVRVVLVAVVLALLALTGCVQVPSAGPVKRVPGQAEVCQNCINVEVAPPAPGAQPREVVEGYLLAMANYQPNYTTAKQFLASTAAVRWRPEGAVSIYTGKLQAEGDSVQLVGTLIGKVGADRTYTAQDQSLNLDFGLVQENGQWRIGRPPAGILVSDYLFDRFYSGYSTYFVGSDRSLVPERIYLPALRNPANIASALMTALLDGPSDWLSAATETKIPRGTSLSVNSVTITNGIAEVPLTDAILTATDPERALIAAQIVYTLRQLPAVKGVLITVNDQKFLVPGADPTSPEIAIGAVSREIDPVPYGSDQLYAVQNGRVLLVTTPTETPGLQELDVPVGRGRLAVESLAVSVNGTDLAMVTDGGKALRRATTTARTSATLTDDLTGLLRPQFSRYGEVWAIGRQGGRQRFWLSSPDLPDTVASPVFGKGEITAFRVSPDGARIALVRRAASGAYAGLARIIRNGTVKVNGWKPIDVRIDIRQPDAPALVRIFDVAWLDANELLVLGASGMEADPVTIRVATDASRVTVEGDEDGWTPRTLTVLTRPQTAIAVGWDGRTWRKNGGQWVPFLSDVTTLAYAG